MSFIEKNLSAGEQIVYKAKLHWYIYLRGLLLIILALLVNKASLGATGFLFFIGCVSLFIAFMASNSTEIAVTNRRVILKTGILKRKFAEIQLNKSEGLTIEEGLMGRMLGFGSLKITSGGVTEVFRPVAKPFEFKKQVNNAIERSFDASAAPSARY